MIAVFVSSEEIIVVGVHSDGSPIDHDGTLFGPESGREMEEFERFEADTDEGQTVHIEKPYRVEVR